jgi:hypothetical protein
VQNSLCVGLIAGRFYGNALLLNWKIAAAFVICVALSSSLGRQSLQYLVSGDTWRKKGVSNDAGGFV